MLSVYYVNEKSENFLAGDTKTNRIAMWAFIAYFLVPIFLAGADTGLLWVLTDTVTIISVVAVLLCLVLLRKEVNEIHSDF